MIGDLGKETTVAVGVGGGGAPLAGAGHCGAAEDARSLGTSKSHFIITFSVPGSEICILRNEMFHRNAET